MPSISQMVWDNMVVNRIDSEERIQELEGNLNKEVKQGEALYLALVKIGETHENPNTTDDEKWDVIGKLIEEFHTIELNSEDWLLISCEEYGDLKAAEVALTTANALLAEVEDIVEDAYDEAATNAMLDDCCAPREMLLGELRRNPKLAAHFKKDT